jgi:hypothetical protein
LLKQADSFLQHKDWSFENLTERRAEPFYEDATRLLNYGSALRETGYSGAAAKLFADAAGLNNAMVVASTNTETKLRRALAIPSVVEDKRTTQPIVIQYGPRHCTGDVWK